MTQPVDPAQRGRERRALVEAVIASTVGTTIEWYDFFLYGTAATLIFPEIFFPQFDRFAGQMASYSTYAVGFIARPLGGVLFGYLGDRLGRKSTLVATLLLMGLSTLLVGFLPTYHQIGLTAAVVLTLLRFLQGIGVGGEWGGAVLLALEYGHRGKRGFYASWPQAGVPLGLLAANGVFAWCQSSLSHEAFLSWGWRLPFYLSGFLIVVGLLIRVRILETPLFIQLQESNRVAQTPVREAFRRHWREILLGAGTRISENACFYLFSIYILDYNKVVLQVDKALITGAIGAAAAVELFTVPLFGILSDSFSRKGLYLLGNLFFIGFALPYFSLLGTREPMLIRLAVILSLAVGHAMLYSVQASLIPELFGTRVRYTGASIGYQLGAPLAGGLAPLIAASLVELVPNSYWPLALYIMLISLLSMVCVWFLAETSRKDISAQD